MVCECPSQCICNKRAYIDCKNGNLTVFPRGIPSNAKSLSLVNNKIPSLNRKDFTGLTSLRYLYLNNGILTNIDEDTFTALRNLSYLGLSDNKLKQICIRVVAYVKVLGLVRKSVDGDRI